MCVCVYFFHFLWLITMSAWFFYFHFGVCLFVSLFSKGKKGEDMGLNGWKGGEDLGEEGWKNIIR